MFLSYIKSGMLGYINVKKGIMDVKPLRLFRDGWKLWAALDYEVLVNIPYLGV